MKNATSTDRAAKERNDLAEYFVRQIEKKFTKLPPVTRQFVIQAFETGYKSGRAAEAQGDYRND